MPVGRVVERHELVKVYALHRARLEREVLVGAQVVDPELLRPRRLGRGLAVEEIIGRLSVNTSSWQSRSQF